MSKHVKAALRELAKRREDLNAAEAKQVEAQREAALAYGQLVLESGGGELDPAAVELLVRQAVSVGSAEVVRRLQSKDDARSTSAGADQRDAAMRDAA